MKLKSPDSSQEEFFRTSSVFEAPLLRQFVSLDVLAFVVIAMIVVLVGCESPPQAQNKQQGARSAGSVKLNEAQKQRLQKDIEEIFKSSENKNRPLKKQDSNSGEESKGEGKTSEERNTEEKNTEEKNTEEKNEEKSSEEKAPDSRPAKSDNESSSDGFDPNPPEEHTIDIPEHWKRLSKNEVWADFKEKQVILGGYICMNMGPLEMFVCPAGTKEHESVVGAKAQASEMHAALLAIGAKPGSPCSWDDTSFTTPSGSIINIDLRWKDEKTGEIITRSAKEMLKNSKTDKELKLDWVFGGSRFYEDPETNEKYYIANSGEMICVSNFSTASIDLNIPSSQINDSLMFLANPDKIPSKGTKVYLILKPGDFVEARRETFPDQEQQSPPNGGQPKPESNPVVGEADSRATNQKSDTLNDSMSRPATDPTTTPPSDKPTSNNG